MKKPLVCAVLSCLSLAAVAGGSIGFRFEADHPDCLYRVGEEAVVTVTATNGAGEAVKDWHCRVEIDNYGRNILGVVAKQEFAKENPFKLRGKLDKPGFLRFRILGKDPEGRWIGCQWGVGYEPERIRPGSARPADFDAFWDEAVAKFEKEVPIDARMELDEAASKGSHDCYLLTFATVPKGRVIRGQLSIPKGDGPWPISMNVPGAGSGSWGFTRPAGRAFLTLNVLDYPCRPDKAAHPVKELYAAQNRLWGGKSGCGNVWYFEGDVSKGREDYFYYGAILGINRAVDWVAALPRIDTRDFRYAGQSQGGAFGIILSALNTHLTRAQIGEPAVTDISGFLADGRQSGWPRLPEKFEGKPCYDNMMGILPYFDCAHFAPRIRIPTRWFVGFVDELCPPAAVWAGYNCLKTTDRKMLNVPGLGHGIPAALYAESEKKVAEDGIGARGPRPMKTRVIQPLYLKGEVAARDCLQWELDELAACDESLDLVVLPEASDVQALVKDREDYFRLSDEMRPKLLSACAATAKRCHAVVFVNVSRPNPSGRANTTVAFDTEGREVGRYLKQHLTPGEYARRYGPEMSAYQLEWNRPYVIEIDGVRYAFLTCYDFYFYENFSNLARMKPDVVIGCSHQRSDPHPILEFLNSFCAYNTAAYLVRASVSMGLDSTVGGSSMVVAPDGRILGNMKSRVGHLDVTIDPFAKYLKPAGFGNPPATHPEYVEKGRRPWKYRPAGGAIVPGFADAPAKRLCAHRGFSAVAPENSLAALGAAVALGAAEVEFDLWWTKDGEIVSIHDPTLDRVSDGTGAVYDKTYAELGTYDFGVKCGEHFRGLRILRFEDILRKLACHTIMNIHLKDREGRPWDEANLRKVLELIDAFDARKHVYFMSSCGPIHDQLARLAPDIPRCMGHGGESAFSDKIIDRAVRHGCKLIQLRQGRFTAETLARAHALGLRCNLFFADDPEEAKRAFDMGIDTVLTNDYQPVAATVGLK